MTPFNMLDDFRFIFPTKKDFYKNVDAKSVNFTQLAMDYCFILYQEREGYQSENVIDIIRFLKHEYAGFYNGKVEFNSGWEREKYNNEMLGLIKKDIHRKMKIFNKARQYHNDIIVNHKKPGTLCVSLFASGIFGEPIPIHMKTLKKLSSYFFNNIRSLSTFKHHVLGYFWVVLKNISDDRPYLHVNFYIDTRDFNHVIGEDINKCWFNALNTIGNRPGGVAHLTISSAYVNGHVSKVTDGYKKNNSANRLAIIMHESNGYVTTNDLNDMNSGEFKHFSNTSGNNHFVNYIYALAKESYFISKGSRSFGSSSINKIIR